MCQAHLWKRIRHGMLGSASRGRIARRAIDVPATARGLEGMRRRSFGGKPEAEPSREAVARGRARPLSSAWPSPFGSRPLAATRKFALCANDTEEGVVCKCRLPDPLDYSLEGKAILFSVFGVAFVRNSVRSVSELSPQTCQAYLRKRIRHGRHGKGVLNHIAAV